MDGLEDMSTLQKIPTKIYIWGIKVVRRQYYYGQNTGICEACGEKMKSHPVCQACGLLIGGGHLDKIEYYRGHRLCCWCAENWRKYEKKMGQEWGWKEFRLNGYEDRTKQKYAKQGI